MTANTTGKVRVSLLKTFSEHGGTQVNPDVVLDASTYLELSGESMRQRMCTFSGPGGEEMCLRPDVTIPLALMVAKGDIGMGAYHYSGRVFRLPPAGSDLSLEFSHTGFEWIGSQGGPTEDAEGLELTLNAIAKTGVTSAKLNFGDHGMFMSLVDAFELSPPWADRLKKAFGRKRGPLEILKDSEDSTHQSSLAEALSVLPEDQMRRAVEEVFAISGISPVGGRDAMAIADRLMDRSRTQKAKQPDKAVSSALQAFLSVDCPARKATDKIQIIAKEAGVNIDAALQKFTARLDALDASEPPFFNTAHFIAGFGRRFDYYDGLVFEVAHASLPQGRSLGAGGRYDGLMSKLSDDRLTANAFGVALRPDRIAEAVEAEAGQ